MERAGPVSGTVRLVAQLGKMFNFIREKISDYIEQSQPGKWPDHHKR